MGLLEPSQMNAEKKEMVISTLEILTDELVATVLEMRSKNAVDEKLKVLKAISDSLINLTTAISESKKEVSPAIINRLQKYFGK
jgi:hypothetical protein